MKHIKIINKMNIILILIVIAIVVFSNYSHAVGDILSGADNFLGKRRPSI